MTSPPLLEHLKAAAAEDWTAYVDHAFVKGLANGTLPEAAFRHYLIQDYLFLIHFARAYGLAAYKADTLADIRQAASTLAAIVDQEMQLHVDFCRGWGLSEAEMAEADEDPATLAYTRFVLERGQAGDLLDLHVALAPCMCGYAEIGVRLKGAGCAADGNPYGAWIEMYASDDFQDVANEEAALLDRLFAERAGEGRRAGLEKTFRQATRLEARFWQMGLDAA